MRQESPQKLQDGREMCLSISDFVPTERTGPFGVFAISVTSEHPAGCSCGCDHGSDYEGMMDRAVRVTLAEAASSWLDAQLEGMTAGSGVRIVKPAAGYACCPDHTLKKDIMEMLPESGRLRISFTESFAMMPDASICGLIFAHPEACYPEIHRISQKQYDDYSSRRGLSPSQTRIFLGHLLG